MLVRPPTTIGVNWERLVSIRLIILQYSMWNRKIWPYVFNTLWCLYWTWRMFPYKRKLSSRLQRRIYRRNVQYPYVLVNGYFTVLTNDLISLPLSLMYFVLTKHIIRVPKMIKTKVYYGFKLSLQLRNYYVSHKHVLPNTLSFWL